MHHKLLIPASAVFLLLAFFLAFRSAFWLLLFIVAASLSELYQLRFRSPVHFELVKFATILSAVAYGLGAALFVGLLTTAFSKLFSGQLDATAPVSLAAIALVAVLAHVFSTLSIQFLGPALVLAYYLLTTPLMLLFGEPPAQAALYVLSSLAFNTLLFLQLAPRILPLL